MFAQWKNTPTWCKQLFLAGILVGLLVLIPAGEKVEAASNSAAQVQCQYYHTVQFGENLFRIGLRYGIPYQVLATVNGIPNPNVIKAGQVLCIPYQNGTGGPPEGIVTNCYFLNVRSGPGVNFGVLEIVSRGTTMQLLGRNSNASWVQVVSPTGQIGWVNSFYIFTTFNIFSLPIVA